VAEHCELLEGLALLLVLALLVIGAYMIEEQFTNPLASQSLGLFASAVLLSSAMALLYELIQVPRRFRKEESLAGKRMLSMAEQAVPAGLQDQGRREAAESGSYASCGPQGLGLSKTLCRSRTRPGVIRAQARGMAGK
jgi:hypothetical protein